MQIKSMIDEKQNKCIVKLEGEIEVNVVADFKKQMDELLLKCPNIDFDCENLEYIDSTGLGAVVYVYKKAKEIGGTVRVLKLKKYIYKLFEITALNRLFDIEVNENE